MTRRSHPALFGLGLWLITSPTHAITIGDEYCGSTTTPYVDMIGESAISLISGIAPAPLGDRQFSLIPDDGFGNAVSIFGAAGQAVTATISHEGLPATRADEASAALSRPFAASGLPHPASLALLGAGLLGFQAVRRRRQAMG